MFLKRFFCLDANVGIPTPERLSDCFFWRCCALLVLAVRVLVGLDVLRLGGVGFPIPEGFVFRSGRRIGQVLKGLDVGMN